MNKRLQMLVEGGIMAAIAMVLSYIPIELPNAAFDLSIGMIPILVYSIRWGAIPGVVCSTVWGLLHIVLGKVYMLSVLQVIFEYPFAFAFAGIGGIFAIKAKSSIFSKETGAHGKTVLWLSIAAFASAFARWFWHFWAGVVIWAEYAPKGVSPFIYSLIVNGASFLANGVMLAVVLVILANAAPVVFRTGVVQSANAK
ncbi:MAG: energy-coupled thiamine transporter ThiT [Clostridiales Family XIII bacterium]|jgi:thiamine transporter|nr:energy-coupled thiamine transporter ThiT [Clostridiales Family XIII bacterium]